MTRTWVALLGSVPAGADRSVEARPREGGRAVLVAWTSRERPHEMALSIDPRALGTGGPPMTVSWVVYPATCRPLFDAPEVLQARRALMRHWPAYGASSLVSDSVHLAGAVSMSHPHTAPPDDPFARRAPGVVLDTEGLLVPLPAPTGPALERYGGAPWPFDSFPS